MDIERELSSHRFATLRAIETGRVELAIVRLNAFVKFAEAYLNAATVRGIRFPPGAANSVSIIDWRTPTQIIDFAADGILAAIRSGNRELIGTAAYLPIQFMRMSVERGDFLFYERMSQIFSSMLAESYSMNSDSSRRLVADLSYRYLREFADYLLPNLVASHEETLREQFAKDLLRAFGELMKVALDRNDLSTFAAIGNDMNSLFQHLDIAGLSKDAASSLRSFAEHERLVVWFGLGAWLLRGVVMRNAKPEPGAPDLRLIDASRIPVFSDVVSRNFSSINQLAGVFENALSRDRGSSNWEWWMLQTLPERKAHWGGFDQWLIYFYVIAGMRMSQNGNPATSDIPSPSRDLDARLNEIRKIVEEVRKDPKTWEPIIPWATGLEARNAEAPIWKYFIAANEAAVA